MRAASIAFRLAGAQAFSFALPSARVKRF